MVKVYLDGIAYNQFGHDVFLTQLKLKTLLALFEVDSNVQRELDIQKKYEIRTFILENLEHNRDFQFTPFIFCARGQIQKDEQGYYIEEGSKLFISDGQHRTLGLEDALMNVKTSLNSAIFTKNEQKIANLKRWVHHLENYCITMQIYLNLDVKQARQLFSDLNTERREAHPGQLLQYDHRDAYSVLTRTIAQRLQGQIDIELKASRVINSSSSLTTLVMMKRCLVALFDGLYVQKSNKTTFPYPQQQVEQIAEAFFLKWLQIFPKHAHKRSKYVAGLTGIQVALALTVYHFTKYQKLSYEEAIEQLSYLKNCSWEHTDSMFRFLYAPEKQCITNHSNSYAIRRLKDAFVQYITNEMVVKQ